MDMETPVWLIAIVAVIAVLVWIGLELRHQRKNPGASHYGKVGVVTQVSETPEGISIKGKFTSPRDPYQQMYDAIEKEDL